MFAVNISLYSLDFYISFHFDFILLFFLRYTFYMELYRNDSPGGGHIFNTKILLHDCFE